MPSPVKTAVSCPPSLHSQGHRYLWGMSSIQVTVPIVFWGRRPPSHEICSICKPDNRSGMATGCRSGQICIWDLHKRHTTGETVVRLSGDLILQVLKFKISSHSIVFLLSNRLSSALVTLVRSPACCIPVTTVQHTTAIICSVEEQTSLSDYGTCTREYWCTRLLCMED